MGTFFILTAFALWVAINVSAHGIEFIGKIFLRFVKLVCVLIIAVFIFGMCLA